MNEELRAKATRTWKEAIEKGNVASLDAILMPNLVAQRTPLPDLVGREAYKQFVEETMGAGSDHEFIVDEWVDDGDKVAVRWEWRFVSTAALPPLNIPPTGKPVSIKGMTLVRTAGGKEAERWDYVDRLGLLQQLGALPPMDAKG